MKSAENILKWSLFAGGIYFFLISMAHIFALKIPGLYIYFNVPSYEYQDKIIAFLTFGWSIYFFQAAKNPVKQINVVKSILFAGAGAIIGLIYINMSTNFTDISHDISLIYFWIETIVLICYLIWLYIYYKQISKKI